MWDTWFGAPTCGIMPSFYNPDLPDGSRGVYYYLIDINTGEYVPTDMYFEDGGLPKLVSGQAEAGDYILVRTGFEDVPTWAQGTGFGDTRVPVYALISKEDYWNNIPNYIEIKDVEG